MRREELMAQLDNVEYELYELLLKGSNDENLVNKRREIQHELRRMEGTLPAA